MREIPSSVLIVLYAFAVYRLTELFVLGLGPFGILERLRKIIGRKAADDNAVRAGNRTVSTELAELVSCPFCVGVWVSSVLTVLYLVLPVVGDIVALVFGLSGVQSALQQSISRRES